MCFNNILLKEDTYYRVKLSHSTHYVCIVVLKYPSQLDLMDALT